MMRYVLAVAAFLMLVLLCWVAWGVQSAYVGLARQQPIATTGFVGAAQCQECHEERHQSWFTTFHRSMTQEANSTSVLGAFDGQTLSAFGAEMRPVIDQGRYFFDYPDPANQENSSRLEIKRTVGSHRYQQYLTEAQDGSGRYFRLHYLWHQAEQRWVHMNAVFLGDDKQPYDAQVASWNNNCIFCHNTGAQPQATNLPELQARAARGEQFSPRDEMAFASKVGDLGIGCESCHGPGAEHVARNADVFRRIALKLSGGVDPTIVNAKRLSADRSTQVCGACHAGRAPKDAAMLQQWVTSGQGYRAGENLNQHVDVVWAHTPSPIASDPNLFVNRFWGDGSVRLTAYEYQGMTQSTCYEEAELSCITCHSMHAGDPAGMLLERNRGNVPCLKCHQEKGGDNLAAHTKHEATGKASLCINCHMPNAVYGVMSIKRTHQISVPDAAQSASAGKPDACTNCHLDRSLEWAQLETATLWKQDTLAPVVRRDGAPADLADGIASLIAGDPVQQAVAAHQAGWADNHVPLDQLKVALPYLVEALTDDRPAIRRFARNSLIALDERADGKWGIAALLADFDFTAEAGERAAIVAKIKANPAIAAIDPVMLAALKRLGQAQEKQIDIGE